MSFLKRLNQQYDFVLVSQSPRRKQLLADLGLKFAIKPQDTPELIRDKKFKKDIVKVTYEKLNSCPTKPGQVLIACDTIVVYKGTVMGKPKNPKQATDFLHKLSNNKHTVWSCVAVKFVTAEHTMVKHVLEATDVYFRKLDEEEIAEYVKTKEPYDKAGGYGIQNTGNLFVKKIKGCYYNVIGLPITALISLIKQIEGEI